MTIYVCSSHLILKNVCMKFIYLSSGNLCIVTNSKNVLFHAFPNVQVHPHSKKCMIFKFSMEHHTLKMETIV